MELVKAPVPVPSDVWLSCVVGLGEVHLGYQGPVEHELQSAQETISWRQREVDFPRRTNQGVNRNGATSASGLGMADSPEERLEGDELHDCPTRLQRVQPVPVRQELSPQKSYILSAFASVIRLGSFSNTVLSSPRSIA